MKNDFRLKQNSINIFGKSTTSCNHKKNFRETWNSLIQFFNYRGSIILTKQQQSEQTKHHNKKKMKNKTKGKKNQIKDLLATIECYQRPQSSKNNFKENNSNFNSNRHQLTWNQLSIHQLLINMSSTIRLTTIKVAFIIGYARKLIKGWSIDGKYIYIYR